MGKSERKNFTDDIIRSKKDVPSVGKYNAYSGEKLLSKGPAKSHR